MNLEFLNCNNIDSAIISLFPGKLNIKLAPNGTGKSTLAKAIVLGAKDSADLSELMPFKLREANPDHKKPEVLGIESIRNVMCFNEGYLRQFVFQKDELLSNSFEILIKSDSYKQKEQEIEQLVSELKSLFSGNPELEGLISTLRELGNAFKITKSGLSKASTGMKALSAGNKLQHIPAGLEPYQPFIQGRNSVGWIDWQTKGVEFLELSENCPFCTSHTADKQEQIKRVGQEYDKTIIKNLVALIDIVNRLGEYFSEEAKEKILKITTLKDGLEKEHEAFLANVKTQIDNLVERLERLKTLSGFQFRDGEKVAEKLPGFKIDLSFFSELKSTKTSASIEPINNSLDAIIAKAGDLQGKINLQRKEMRRLIEKHQKNINGFLAYAGYNYLVEISGEDDKAQLKLRHKDYAQHLNGGDQHLSFGERNAFAIVLFMHECLSKNPDLIILDDPISSFDKNKKYAIFEMLFRREPEACFKNKSVLMLTHDVEPIIDTVRALSRQFGDLVAASFLSLKESQIREQEIGFSDIQTFAEICKSALSKEIDDVVKLIYLRRRFEIIDSKGNAYQVLSNLFHKRLLIEATDTREPKNADEKYPLMDTEKVACGVAEISGLITGFDYHIQLTRIVDNSILKAVYSSCMNGYEKLQICRLIKPKGCDPVIEKFINETYHIENEFICQLDPAKYDIIPEYVMKACDKIVAEVG